MENYNEYKWKQMLALKKLREIDEDIYDSYEDKEQYWALQHWVNNPLVSPKSKMDMFDRHIEFERNKTEGRIFHLLKKHLYMSEHGKCACNIFDDSPTVSFDEWVDHVKGLM